VCIVIGWLAILFTGRYCNVAVSLGSASRITALLASAHGQGRNKNHRHDRSGDDEYNDSVSTANVTL
jgi:hypothetical protein